MALEQETASIIKFILDKTGSPAPYYSDVPEGFSVPSVFFPQPEIASGGDTFLTYELEYAWYIVFFHKSAQDAYDLGLTALTAIKKARNLIPLIDETGAQIDDGIRLDDPKLKALDDGAAQLTLTWRSRRPYEDTLRNLPPATKFNGGLFTKSATDKEG